MIKILIFLISFSQMSLAQIPSSDPHAGHAHNSSEICDQPASPVDQLAADTQQVISESTLSPEFCEAHNLCSQYSSTNCTGVQRRYLEGYNNLLNNSDGGSCGLTFEEYVAKQFYMDNGYDCMNRFQWGLLKIPQISFLVDKLKSGLSKYPRYEGLVVRGATLPPGILAQHTEGSTVTYQAFTSASTSRKVANRFAMSSSIFLIHSATGRPIMGPRGTEYEVLFSTNTQFRIIDVSKKDGVNYFVMRELAGPETRKQQEDADRRVMNSVRNRNNRNPNPDRFGESQNAERWVCPVNDGPIPTSIEQTIIPATIGFGGR